MAQPDRSADRLTATSVPGQPGPSRWAAGVLGRLGWGCDRAVPCRDLGGGPARLLVHLGAAGVVISASSAGPLRLDAGQVRRLGAVLAAAERRHENERRGR